MPALPKPQENVLHDFFTFFLVRNLASGKLIEAFVITVKDNFKCFSIVLFQQVEQLWIFYKGPGGDKVGLLSISLSKTQ